MENEIENKDFVVCKLCNKEFLNLGTHIVLLHKIKTIEYLQQFPDAVLISQVARDSNSRKLKGVTIEKRMGKERADEISKIISNSHKDGKRKNAYKKCSASLKGRSMEELFGKEEAIQRKKHLSEMWGGISLEERYGSVRAEDLKSLWGKQRKGHSTSEITRERISSKLKNRPPHSKERRDKISNTLIEGHANGTLLPTGGVVKGRKTYYQHQLQGQILLKSSTEFSYVQLLEYLSTNFNTFIWLYEAERFSFTGENEKLTTLTPDFTLLYDWNKERIINTFGTLLLSKKQIQEMIISSKLKKIVEIKGYWNEKHISYRKWNLFCENFPNEKASIFTCKQLVKVTKELELNTIVNF